MAFELKEGQGTFFKNDRKKDNQPDYRGTCKVNGQLLDISGWTKVSKTGSKFISLSVKPKLNEQNRDVSQGGNHSAPAVQSPPPASSDMDDEIPF